MISEIFSFNDSFFNFILDERSRFQIVKFLLNLLNDLIINKLISCCQYLYDVSTRRRHFIWEYVRSSWAFESVVYHFHVVSDFQHLLFSHFIDDNIHLIRFFLSCSELSITLSRSALLIFWSWSHTIIRDIWVFHLFWLWFGLFEIDILSYICSSDNIFNFFDSFVIIFRDKRNDRVFDVFLHFDVLWSLLVWAWIWGFEFWIFLVNTDLNLNFGVFESWSDFEVQVIKLFYFEKLTPWIFGVFDDWTVLIWGINILNLWVLGSDLIWGLGNWTVLFWGVNIMDFGDRIKWIYEV